MKVQCQVCQGLFDVEEGMAGSMVQCPYCGNSVPAREIPAAGHPQVNPLPPTGAPHVWQTGSAKTVKFNLKKILFLISCGLFGVSFLFVLCGIRGSSMEDYLLSSELFNIAFALQGTALFLLLVGVFFEKIWNED